MNINKERYLVSFPRPRRMAGNVFVGYPSSYSAGMSNLGFHFLFRKLRSNPYIRTERFFLDTAPFTLESGSRISTAPIIFFSISYEEDYLNLARILERSGIPAGRLSRGGRPLVVAGGPAPSANPFPVSEMADIISIGEGEEALSVISDILSEDGVDNPESLPAKLSGVEGIFIPGMRQKRLKFARAASIEQFPHSFAVTPETAFGDMMLIETGRGCPGRCLFCLSESIYSPLRFMSFDQFREQLADIPGFPQKVARVGLVSTAVAANPDFMRIVEYLLEMPVSPSFSSLRAEDIAGVSSSLIARTGIRSAAIAPESGSESGRARLGKSVPDSTYIDAARILAEGGVERIVIYLLTGYPGEDQAVMEQTGQFLRRLKEAGGKTSLDIHINTIVPKPWTPLEFYPLPSERELADRGKILAKTCREFGRVRVKSIRSAIRQAVFSLGDERVGRAAVEFGRGEVSWKKALKSNGVDPMFVHMERKTLPWHRIEGPAGEDQLRRRYLETF